MYNDPQQPATKATTYGSGISPNKPRVRNTSVGPYSLPVNDRHNQFAVGNFASTDQLEQMVEQRRLNQARVRQQQGDFPIVDPKTSEVRKGLDSQGIMGVLGGQSQPTQPSSLGAAQHPVRTGNIVTDRMTDPAMHATTGSSRRLPDSPRQLSSDSMGAPRGEQYSPLGDHKGGSAVAMLMDPRMQAIAGNAASGLLNAIAGTPSAMAMSEAGKALGGRLVPSQSTLNSVNNAAGTLIRELGNNAINERSRSIADADSRVLDQIDSDQAREQREYNKNKYMQGQGYRPAQGDYRSTPEITDWTSSNMWVNPQTGMPAQIDNAQRKGVADANRTVDSRLASQRTGDQQRSYSRGPYSGGFGVAVSDASMEKIMNPEAVKAREWEAQKQRAANSAAAQGIAKRQKDLNTDIDGTQMVDQYGRNLYRPDDTKLTDWIRKSQGLSAGDDIKLTQDQIKFYRHKQMMEENDKYRDRVEGMREARSQMLADREAYKQRRRDYRTGNMSPEDAAKFSIGLLARRDPAMAAQLAMSQIAMGQELQKQQLENARRAEEAVMSMAANAASPNDAIRIFNNYRRLKGAASDVVSGNPMEPNVPAASGLPPTAPLPDRMYDAHQRAVAAGFEPGSDKYKQIMEGELGPINPEDLAREQGEAKKREAWERAKEKTRQYIPPIWEFFTDPYSPEKNRQRQKDQFLEQYGL